MTNHSLSHASRSRIRRPFPRPSAPSLVAGLALVGAATIAAGVLLPWLTLYAGLQSLRGSDGVTGPILLVGAASAALVGLLASRLPTARSILPIIGFALLAYAAYLLIGLIGLYRDLAAHPLDVAAFGPGLPIVVAGSALVFATAFVPTGMERLQHDARHPRSWRALTQVAVATLLVAAGIAHLYLAPEHLAESTLLGIGFVGAGVAQLALAAGVLVRLDRRLLWAVIALNLALIVLYAWNVLLGLPIVGPEAAAVATHGHEAAEHAHEGGLLIGIGEPVDAAGALTKAAELIALIGAGVLLWRPSGQLHSDEV